MNMPAEFEDALVARLERGEGTPDGFSMNGKIILAVGGITIEICELQVSVATVDDELAMCRIWFDPVPERIRRIHGERVAKLGHYEQAVYDAALAALRAGEGSAA